MSRDFRPYMIENIKYTLKYANISIDKGSLREISQISKEDY